MEEKRGKNLESIQIANRALVLSLLQRNQVAARSELAAQSGLKQPTITKIIGGFLERGIVRETGFLEGKKGRRSIAVTLSPELRVIAVRISRQYVMTGVMDLMGEQVDGPYTTDVRGAAPEEVIRTVRREIAARSSRYGDTVLAVGVAVPGPYFSGEDIFGFVTDWPGWEGVQIRRELQTDLHLPVVVEHDANAGLLAEMSFSAQKDPDATTVYLALGQGIGAGICAGGHVLRGAQGIAGEIGHICVDAAGPPCGCGNRGCLTHYASTTAFVRYAQDVRDAYPESCLRDGFGIAEVLAALEHDDPAAEAAFERFLDYLVAGIINLIYAYNPHTIIVGDEMAAAGERLLRGIWNRICCLRPASLTRDLEVRIASYQPEPAYIGAAAAASHYLFRRPERLECRTAG